MAVERKKVIRDFLTFKKDDIISFLINGSSDTIYIDVENREIDVKFFGNENGKWGKDNPAPSKGKNTTPSDYRPGIDFMWIKEKVNPFRLMEMKIPSVPPDLTKPFSRLYSQQDWIEMYMEKVICDLVNDGIIEE